MKRLNDIFLGWLPFFFIVTCSVWFASFLIQQDLRMGINDRLVQRAEGDAVMFEKAPFAGSKEGFQVTGGETELSSGINEFSIMYDAGGNITYSDAVLHGKVPELPKGVLDFTKENGEDRITWQPEAGARFAVVVKYYSGKQSGYLLIGQSLREVENRKDMIMVESVIAWGVTSLGSFVLYAITRRQRTH